MLETNESLIGRLCAEPGNADWKLFHQQYNPIILRYGRKLGLTYEQAKDVRQKAYLALLKTFEHFRYNRERGLFRNFLLTIVHREAVQLLQLNARDYSVLQNGDAEAWQEMTSPRPDALPDKVDQRRWRESVLEEVLAGLWQDPLLDPQTVEIFFAYAVENQPVEEVTKRYGISENNLYQIKHRVTRKVRDKVARMLRDGDLLRWEHV